MWLARTGEPAGAQGHTQVGPVSPTEAHIYLGPVKLAEAGESHLWGKAHMAGLQE